MLCGGSPVLACGDFGLAAGAGDDQGQVFEFGDEGAEAAVVVEPAPVVLELLVGDEAGDCLTGCLAAIHS